MHRFVATAALAATVVCAAPAAQASVVRNFNLVTIGDLDSTSNVEGRAFVGRDLLGTSSDYATKLNAQQFAGVDTLVVGRNISVQNIQLQAGNLRLGGTRTGNVNFNGGGQQINDPGVSLAAAALGSELGALSTSLRNLTANSSVVTPQNQSNARRFVASPSGPDNLAVFAIDTSLFTGGVAQLELVTNGASSIIINVTGGSLNFSGVNFVGDWNTAAVRSTTMWNFHQATSLTLQNAWNGALLAPGAVVTNFNNLEGGAYVRSLIQRGEVHLPQYNGFIPTPGSVALLGLAGLAAARRRR